MHTDRDQRIKVQFHWQRGAAGSHRLDHLTGDDNAPTSDASGTWVRVATPVAGQNWGSVFDLPPTNHPSRNFNKLGG